MIDHNKVLINTIPSEKLEEFTHGTNSVIAERVNASSENAEHGLAKLVLTLIEAIRKLVEKQAIRRVEGGTLSEEEIERLGETLMKLELKMQELKTIFGLKDEDLTINLGPLGNLR
jgi:hypothetical protein